jgi:PTS system mannose-specific IIC component
MIGARAVGAAAGVAALELDAASIGPFLLSRPLVAGPLIGWLQGDAGTGAAIGVAFEAVSLAELPLGGRLELSASVAAGTAAWLACGGILPSEAAFLAGLAAGFAHARVEARLRRARGALARSAEESLRSGRSPWLGAKIASALTVQAAATFAVALAAIALAGAVGPALWSRLPELVRVGSRTAFIAAPWIGAGGLAATLMRRA